MNKKINNLTTNLKELFDERLESVILYGSCVIGDCEGDFSDINAIVLINNLTAIDLKNSYSLIKEFSTNHLWGIFPYQKHPAPLFMDKTEWLNSCDVYPIEYSDIKARYKIIYGNDFVANLNLEKKNLRHQCEYEMKNLLIKLRQNYLSKSNNKKEIEHLLKVSSKSFFAVFRAILRLTEENVPFGHKEVIDLLSQKVKIDKEIFIKIFELRTNSNAINKKEYEIAVQKMIDSADEILKYVDKLN